MRVRRSVAFFRMVAAKRAGEGGYAEELYSKFAEEIKNEGLSEEEQKRIEAERKRKAAAKKAAAERKAKKEYDTYLKLKQKYEKDMK